MNLTRDPLLSAPEIHVWRMAFSEVRQELHAFERLLSPDEFRKAGRFHFSRDREGFIAARAGLRLLLGRYLKADPAELRFLYSPYGKPSLARSAGMQDIRFNVSHSDDLTLYAFAEAREVGIDVERIRSCADLEEIALSFFTPREADEILSFRSGDREEAFYRCWTQKEAYVKGVGAGLSLPLNQFDVSDLARENKTGLRRRAADDPAANWTVESLAIDTGYRAALAVEGADFKVCRRQWDSTEPC